MTAPSLPTPITFAEVTSAAVEVADATRGSPIARKARMVAVFLDVALNRMKGAELADLRRRASVTQVQFAERLGVSQTTVSDMERGRRPVTPEAALLAIMAEKRARREASGARTEGDSRRASGVPARGAASY